MKAFEINVLSREFFQHHVLTLHQLHQLFVFDQRRFFVAERFSENVANIVFVRFQQRADPERRMRANLGDQLAGGSGVRHRFGCLRFKPIHDRYPVVSVDHE